MTFPDATLTDDEYKAIMLWDIETFPDHIVFTGPDGKTSTLMIADALAILKEGDIT